MEKVRRVAAITQARHRPTITAAAAVIMGAAAVIMGAVAVAMVAAEAEPVVVEAAIESAY